MFDDLLRYFIHPIGEHHGGLIKVIHEFFGGEFEVFDLFVCAAPVMHKQAFSVLVEEILEIDFAHTVKGKVKEVFKHAMDDVSAYSVDAAGCRQFQDVLVEVFSRALLEGVNRTGALAPLSHKDQDSLGRYLCVLGP